MKILQNLLWSFLFSNQHFLKFAFNNHQAQLLFRPPLVGEELYTQMVFLVQTILADRYIHHRELRLVLLDSLSSVQYGIKKIFLIFAFDREISRFKLSIK